jgi:CDP-diacylglycerol--serine O-phosphatidyltransferase
MKGIRRNIPNLLTSLNLLSGVVGLLLLMQGNISIASLMILIAGVFDFLDGMLARLLHVKSALGKELDSLADVVSFGVLPGFILYEIVFSKNPDWVILSFVPLLIPVFSALRLAKFNTDSRQEEEFRGMPTPAMAIFVASLQAPYGISDLFEKTGIYSFLFHPLTLSALSLILCILMISEFRLFSLKLKKVSFTAYPYAMVFLIISVLLVSVFKTAGLGLSIIVYVLISVIKILVERKARQF